MTRLVATAAALALASLAAADASAGSLAKTTKSISNKQKSSSGNSGSTAPREPRAHGTHVYYGDGYYNGRTPYYATYYRAPCTGCAPVAITRQTKPATRLDFRATYENVRDSDGSLNLDARVSAGPFGFGFGVSSYYEAERNAPEAVRMTLWEGNIAGRALLLHDRTELWLTLGAAGLHSNQFEDVLGGAVGADLRHAITGGLSVDGRARAMLFEGDISASELRAGVTASVLHLGYRYLRFNVGPALQGPEVGLSLRF